MRVKRARSTTGSSRATPTDDGQGHVAYRRRRRCLGGHPLLQRARGAAIVPALVRRPSAGAFIRGGGGERRVDGWNAGHGARALSIGTAPEQSTESRLLALEQSWHCGKPRPPG